MYEIRNKSDLRKHFKSVRLSMPTEQKNAYDKKVFENLTDTVWYRDCKDLLVYVSSDIEVSTRDIMALAFRDKNVLCPKCINGTNEMDFYEVSDFTQLERGAYGILEPDSSCIIRNVFENAVCIVPGLSYDDRGYRLGFGKGYYDRFLSSFSGIKIGICYECCLSEVLPNDKYDIKVDMLVTEKRIVSFAI